MARLLPAAGEGPKVLVVPARMPMRVADAAGNAVRRRSRHAAGQARISAQCQRGGKAQEGLWCGVVAGEAAVEEIMLEGGFEHADVDGKGRVRVLGEIPGGIEVRDGAAAFRQARLQEM